MNRSAAIAVGIIVAAGLLARFRLRTSFVHGRIRSEQADQADGQGHGDEVVQPSRLDLRRVVGPDGKIVNWALETGGANALIRRGWKKEDLRPARF